MIVHDLIRNPPDMFSAKTLYFVYYDDESLGQILGMFGDFEVFVYEYPGQVYSFGS